MRKLTLALLVLALTPALAFAQDSQGRRGQGYLFVAPGGVSAAGQTEGTIHFGLGGEYLIYKGLGAGGEVGYLAPMKSFGDGIGLASLNGSYHFVDPDKPRKVVPFVTVGYTRSFANNSGANLLNFGGGINWWMRDRLGLRLEARDHVHTNGPTGHFWQFRFALSFR